MVSFNEAANRSHEILCDRLKVPRDWVLVRLIDFPYERYYELMDKMSGHWKFLEVDFDPMYQQVKGEFLVDPEWSKLLV
jgi:hypothetical protein